ncbi:hypothetical protein [Paenibacillus abyssi]|uniref:Uncharacterized protein n=1 Tax=Paenibacillus abyssi TaxID=1340531 RepID=A0A917D4D9_9BACL|nr:hypothetical protein [Paenibacillus abyssi]GGG09607.1 hypothetical protein GCM10010916_28090 [Paenibacillus abyssi]
MKEYALLGVWLVGLFGIIAIVIVCVARMVIMDSMSYDRKFLWHQQQEEIKETPKK